MANFADSIVSRISIGERICSRQSSEYNRLVAAVRCGDGIPDHVNVGFVRIMGLVANQAIHAVMRARSVTAFAQIVACSRRPK